MLSRLIWVFACKCVLNRKISGVAGSEPHAQFQRTTLAASKIVAYMRRRREEYVEPLKTIEFPWFLGVLVFDDNPPEN